MDLSKFALQMTKINARRLHKNEILKGYYLFRFILVKRLQQNLRNSHVYKKYKFRSYHKSILKTSLNYAISNLTLLIQ